MERQTDRKALQRDRLPDASGVQLAASECLLGAEEVGEAAGEAWWGLVSIVVLTSIPGRA